MFLDSTEMNIEFVEMFEKSSQWRAFGHFCKSIHVLREALATIAKLAIWTRYVGVSFADVARKENACVHLTPVGSHLLAIFAAGVEISDLVGAKHVVHIFCKLGLKRSHDGKLLTHENLAKKLVRTSEHHGLTVEIFDICALGKEFRHVAHLVTSLL